MGKTNLLLVEDDDAMAAEITAGCSDAGYTVQRAAALNEARRLLDSGSYTALILDRMLPDGDGEELARWLRGKGLDMPVLMLTARSAVAERVEGLAAGADDYLCKPFSIEELVARIEAVLRRAQGSRTSRLRYDGLEFDLIDRTAFYCGDTAVLSERETALLAYLMENAERVLPRNELLEHVWDGEPEQDGSVLNVYVNYLRNKIERGRHPRLIHTVRGVGYVLTTRAPVNT